MCVVQRYSTHVTAPWIFLLFTNATTYNMQCTICTSGWLSTWEAYHKCITCIYDQLLVLFSSLNKGWIQDFLSMRFTTVHMKDLTYWDQRVYKLEISYRQKGKIKCTLNTYVVEVGNIKVVLTWRFIMFNVRVHQHFLLSHGDQIK